jgi:hypothetical protein
MTEQPNQNCPEESPDPTHLRSVDGSYARHPETFPLGRNVLRNRRSGPQSLVACNRELHEVVRNQEEGSKMQVEKPPVHKRVHNVHTPFGRTNT